jgi:hypothetical protein
MQNSGICHENMIRIACFITQRRYVRIDLCDVTLCLPNPKHGQMVFKFSTMVLSASNLRRQFTDCRGRVVNTPALYSGGTRFRSGPREWLSCLRVSWFSSVSPDECWDSIIKLGHVRYLLYILSNSSFTYHVIIQRCSI